MLEVSDCLLRTEQGLFESAKSAHKENLFFRQHAEEIEEVDVFTLTSSSVRYPSRRCAGGCSATNPTNSARYDHEEAIRAY